MDIYDYLKHQVEGWLLRRRILRLWKDAERKGEGA